MENLGWPAHRFKANAGDRRERPAAGTPYQAPATGMLQRGKDALQNLRLYPAKIAKAIVFSRIP